MLTPNEITAWRSLRVPLSRYRRVTMPGALGISSCPNARIGRYVVRDRVAGATGTRFRLGRALRLWSRVQGGSKRGAFHPLVPTVRTSRATPSVLPGRIAALEGRYRSHL